MNKKYEPISIGNGYHLYIEDNKVGGRRYSTDEVGGGSHVWDTSCVSADALDMALRQEKFLYAKELNKANKRYNQNGEECKSGIVLKLIVPRNKYAEYDKFGIHLKVKNDHDKDYILEIRELDFYKKNEEKKDL